MAYLVVGALDEPGVIVPLENSDNIVRAVPSL